MADSTNVISDFQFIAGSVIFASLAVILFVLFNRKSSQSEPETQNGPIISGDGRRDVTEVIHKVKRPPLPISAIKLSQFDHVFGSFPKSCQLTLTEAWNLEAKTRDQGLSPLWKVERSRRLTASYFGSVAKRRKVVNVQFVNRLRGLGRRVVTRYMQEGVANESPAVERYKEVRPVLVFDVGFCVNPGLPIIGATPDRLVYDKEVGEFGLLEIKTLAKAKELRMSVKEAVTSKRTKCCLKIRHGDQLYLDRNHDYFYQVQGQLGVTRLKWCDFYVEAHNDSFCQRITFDETFFNKMAQKLIDFYLKHYIRALEE